MRPEHKRLQITKALVGFVAAGAARHLDRLPREHQMREVGALHREIFPFNQSLLGEARLLVEGRSCRWTLSNGRVLITPFLVYAVRLPFDYEGVVGYSEVSEAITIDEAIEMVAILRGTPERIVPGSACKCDFLDMAPTESDRSFSDVTNSRLTSEQTLVPVLYVMEFDPWVETADELLRQYARELVAIRNLTVGQADLLDSDHIRRSTREDAHPFVYGVTLFSPVCTVEFHPRSTLTAVEREQGSLEKHHIREWTFLTGLLLVIALARTAMSGDSRRLDALLSRERSTNLFKGLFELTRLSGHRRAIAARLHIYRNVDLPRREYMRDILERAREAFGLEGLYLTIRDKLNDLANDINALYSAYLTTAAFILGIVTAVLAALAVLQGVVKRDP